jgi:hypothetical protein
MRGYERVIKVSKVTIRFGRFLLDAIRKDNARASGFGQEASYEEKTRAREQVTAVDVSTCCSMLCKRRCM